MYSPLIQKLIEKFSKFPTVGPRTAARFVFYLLRTPQKEVEELIELLKSAKEKIKFCKFCFKTVEQRKVCEICSDRKRDRSLLCVVEKEQDLEAIENTKKYQGLYFIFGGTIGKLKTKDLKNLRVEELKKRAADAEVKEIILAFNPTLEGEATILYLERNLKNLGKKISLLGRGLPTGGEIEYADEETISWALERRK